MSRETPLERCVSNDFFKSCTYMYASWTCSYKEISINTFKFYTKRLHIYTVAGLFRAGPRAREAQLGAAAVLLCTGAATSVAGPALLPPSGCQPRSSHYYWKPELEPHWYKRAGWRRSRS